MQNTCARFCSFARIVFYGERLFVLVRVFADVGIASLAYKVRDGADTVQGATVSAFRKVVDERESVLPVHALSRHRVEGETVRDVIANVDCLSDVFRDICAVDVFPNFGFLS